ncbi:hypothetical protein [Streptomyces sp. NPDC002537]
MADHSAVPGLRLVDHFMAGAGESVADGGDQDAHAVDARGGARDGVVVGQAGGQDLVEAG